MQESLQGRTACVEAYIQHITTTVESGERYNREAWIASCEDGLLVSGINGRDRYRDAAEYEWKINPLSFHHLDLKSISYN